ncbi:DUF3854 domain-containing protein [Microcoleus sp. BR0-C5]|uniref:plasmid replication protein, CyRepA1 family n=1 Tax=Microcoleus sp. BR0-C5 TaxID=2818713 RepID=UPI002FD13B45
MSCTDEKTTKSVKNLSEPIVTLSGTDLDSVKNLVYQDCVVRSGIKPKICELNFEPANGLPVYDLVYRDNDKILKSGDVSAQARRNYSKCEGVGGFIVNGRFRQLSGPPLARDEKGRARKYHQPKGKPLEYFCPLVDVPTWREIAAKEQLAMPDMPAVGLNGEALGFWDWVIESGCSVVATEGEKKAAALVSRGYAAIGLPGIYTGYRVTKRGFWVFCTDSRKDYQKAAARELHAALKPFDTKNRLITILFDFRRGDYSQSPEFKAASITAKLFENAIVTIAQLPGPEKGADDFIVAGGDIDAVIGNGKTCKELAKLEHKTQWRNSRKYTPHCTIDSQYFHALEPAAGTITGIKSGLATGKTQWLKNVIASNPEGKIIVIGSRNGLLLQTAEKCGFYHLDIHNGYVMLRNPDARICLCFDSLLKLLDSGIFEGATIILDEAESVIRHLLMSNTLKHNREAIKGLFSQACKDASRIVLLDGHLTDYTVNLVTQLAGNKITSKHLNKFTANCPKVSVFKTENAKLSPAEKQDFINKILASDCPVIVTDCCVPEAEALAETLTKEKGLGLLICSKTSMEPDSIAIQTNPDVCIEQKKLAWIILSPSVENGLDISIREKFTDVFGLFCGLLGVNSLIQMLRRVRHPINQISVLCPEIGLPTNDPDRRSYYENQIKIQLESNLLLESMYLTPEELYSSVKASLDKQFNDPLFHAYLRYEAQENLEKSDLRAFLIEALRDGGYEVDEPTIGADESGDHVEKKKVYKEKESQEIFDATDISLEEAQEISRSNKARWPERCQAEKAFLKAKLPGIEDTQTWRWEFVHRVKSKDRALLTQLENAWLFNHPDDDEYLQRLKWETGKLEYFAPDHNSNWLKREALRKLNITQFLTDSGWTNTSPEVQKLLKDGGRKDARRILGEPGKDGIKYVNRLLGLIGITLVCRQMRGEDGQRVRTYHYQPQASWKKTKQGSVRICSLPEDWNTLFALTAARMNQKVEAKKVNVKSNESFTPSALDAVTDEANCVLINSETSVTVSTPQSTPQQSGGDVEIHEPSEVMLDPQAHQECLEFIRAAIAQGDAKFAQQVAVIVKEVCEHGHANREAIWAELSEVERQQFRSLLVKKDAVFHKKNV